jgi:hypothetical protein
VLKSPPIANLQNVSTHPKRPTRQTMDELKMKYEKPTLRQNQKELQPTAQCQNFAAHLLLPQPHDKKQQNIITLTTTKQNENKKC